MKKFVTLCMLLPLLAGCEKQDGPIQITEFREGGGGGGGPTASGLSTAQRLGMSTAPARGTVVPAGGGYTWETPEGWTELPTSKFRQVANFSIAGDSGAECYVSKAGGSVEENVNRWRGQMGLAPLDAAAVEALPRKTILGEDAIFLDIEGTYSGMGGGAPKENMRMLGLILPLEPQALFVKLLAPKEVAAEELAHFDAFCASLSSGALDPHAGLNMGGADPHAGLNTGGADPHAGIVMSAAALSAPAYHWTVPEGWTEIPSTSGMRMVRPMVTLQAGASECSVFNFSSSVGGLEGVVQMWLSQMGHDPTAGTDAAQREAFEMLGTEATLVRILGDYQGKSGQSGKDYAMLSAYCPVGGSTIVVKFVGPEAEVAAQESAFRAFCASLYPAQH